jgi:hypothetical protein
LLSDPEIDQIVKDARTIAVVGMQDESHAHRAAYQIPAMLKQRGYEILPVNPHIQSSMGLKAVANVGDWTTVPDILDVFRRSDAIPELADELLALPPEKRPKAVWLQSGITHPEAEERLEKAGMKVVSDRCLGVYASRLKAFPRAEKTS